MKRDERGEEREGSGAKLRGGRDVKCSQEESEVKRVGKEGTGERREEGREVV